MEPVREALLSARGRIEGALASLPEPPAYEPAARQLREIASVSPSLLAWLEEIPPLSAPLAGSVHELREALRDLEGALRLLGEPAASEPAPGAGRAKVVVRG
jgi:hypothetical protein